MSHPTAEQPANGAIEPEFGVAMETISAFDITRQEYLDACRRYYDQRDPRDLTSIQEAERRHRRSYRETLTCLSHDTSAQELALCALRLLAEQDQMRTQPLNATLGREVLKQIGKNGIIPSYDPENKEAGIDLKRWIINNYSAAFALFITEDTTAFLAEVHLENSA